MHVGEGVASYPSYGSINIEKNNRVRCHLLTDQVTGNDAIVQFRQPLLEINVFRRYASKASYSVLSFALDVWSPHAERKLGAVFLRALASPLIYESMNVYMYVAYTRACVCVWGLKKLLSHDAQTLEPVPAHVFIDRK